jgi:hypothetical protein
LRFAGPWALGAEQLAPKLTPRWGLTHVACARRMLTCARASDLCYALSPPLLRIADGSEPKYADGGDVLSTLFTPRRIASLKTLDQLTTLPSAAPSSRSPNLSSAADTLPHRPPPLAREAEEAGTVTHLGDSLSNDSSAPYEKNAGKTKSKDKNAGKTKSKDPLQGL